MIVGLGNAWATDVDFAPSNFTDQGTSGTGSAISATVDGVTFACNKGYGTTQIRCYSGGKITISSSNTISAISFTFSGSYTGGLSTSYSDLSTTSWEKTLSSQARITAVKVTYTAAPPAYTITAQSNNVSYGEVSLNGSVITGAPKEGCRYSDPAYTVNPANSATVVQDGNAFTVTPSANTTVTINFEPIPTHTATFSVNGVTTTQDLAEGAAIVFPANPADISDNAFVGWTTSAFVGTTNDKPEFVTTATMGTENQTYYAVFASVTKGSSTTITDELTRSTTGITGTTYKNFGGTQSNSDAEYGGNCAGGYSAIQLRSNDNVSGIISTVSGGKVKKISVVWNSNTSSGRTLTIYGKNTAYTNSSNLYETLSTQGTKLGEIAYGTSTELTVTGDYAYVGIRSKDGALYLDKISIDWESGTPDTYSDYCTTVVAAAVEKPSIAIAENPFLFSTTATITCTTEGATIKYSYDGENWNDYTEALTITEAKTIYAKAIKGDDESSIVQVTATKNLAEPTVTISATDITNTNVFTGTAAGSLAASVTYNDAAVEGAAVTWSGNKDEVATIDPSTGAVTLVAAGSVTFTATYAGNGDYSEKAATYEMTVTNSDPNANDGSAEKPYATMDEIFTASAKAGNYYVTLDNWVVSGVNGNQAFVTDNNGKGFIIYKSGHGFAVGDILSGTVQASLTRYKGAAEFTSLTSETSGLTVTTGGTLTPQVVTIDELSGVNTGAVVQVKGVSYNGTYLVDGSDNSIKPYTTLYSGTYTNGKEYNVTGIYVQFDDTKEILPRSAADIVENVGPSITVASSLAVPNYVIGTTEPTYETLTVNGSNLTADITLSLGESSNFEMSSDLDNWTNSLTLTQSEGGVTDVEVAIRLKAGLAKGAYEGTLTLSSTGADNAEVSLSGSVTGQTYAIEQYTTPATAHGTITFSPASPVEDGTEVTLSAEPTEGYTFTADSWVIYKQSGEDYVVDNSVAVTDNKITMPAYAIYVDATFAPIAVTGVTLNKTKATIGIDDSETLTATIAPANAQNKAVAWESSNTDVATVANGVVTGVAEGTATITATTEDGSFTATCDVTVMNAVIFDCSSDTETSKNGVSFKCSDISSTDGFKFHKSSSTTFSVANGVIKKIEFTCTASGTTKYGPGCFGEGAPSGYTYSGTIGTWEGSATSVDFTATDNQVRATKIKVFVTTTAIPTFSVAEGEYDEAKNVELSCATEGATIYYTTNGDTPTSSSTEYAGGISITETTTLKAIAIKDKVASAVASATYTMIRPAAPSFDKAAFVFDAAFDVHLSTETDGATIYYTTDGSTPTNSSNAYTDKGISINTGSDVTVKAIAFKNGLTSDVASVTYTYDARVTPTFALSTTSLNLKVNDASDAITVTTNSDVDVAFTCEDAHVTLTGTGNSRTISANAAGTYTVNVSVTGSATYKDAEGTITVTVTKKAATMAISTVFDDGLDLRYAHGGVIEGIVKYNDIALDPQPTVTFASSDENVATVDEEGNITFKKVGTTKITASFAGDDEYEECEDGYDLVLFDTTPQATKVDITLNNTFFGCSSFTSWTTGMATSLSGVSENVTVTYGKGTSANMYCNSEKVRYYTNNTFTIDAPTGYHVIAVDMNVAIGSATPSGTVTSDTWEGDASSVSFTFANKTDISSISVTLAPVVTLNKYGYATYCSPHPIDFSKAEGFTAWRISDVDANGTVTFSKITETIKEGQGVLLYNKDADGENKTTVTLTVGESEGATEYTTSENKLVGITEPTAIEADTYYGLKDNKFVKVNAGTIPAGKALLPASEIPSGARELNFVFEGEQTTSVSEECRVKSEEFTTATIFDLQGRKVTKPQKGLYIVNGRKVVVK